MSAEILTFEKANTVFKTELIANGRGTQALHETVVAYRANRRSGTRGTKTKGTVQKSGRKPWRQKGTGRARAGYFASPVWRGGGVVFGPQPHDFSKKTPAKVKRLALKKALSERVKSGDVLLVPSLEIAEAKTKALVAILKKFNVEGSVLVVTESQDKKVYLASRNHPEITVTTGSDVNAEDLLRRDRVVITEAAAPENF